MDNRGSCGSSGPTDCCSNEPPLEEFTVEVVDKDCPCQSNGQGGSYQGGSQHGGSHHGDSHYGGSQHGGSHHGGSHHGGSHHGGSHQGGFQHGDSHQGGSHHGGSHHGRSHHGGSQYGGSHHGGSQHGRSHHGGFQYGGSLQPVRRDSGGSCRDVAAEKCGSGCSSSRQTPGSSSRQAGSCDCGSIVSSNQLPSRFVVKNMDKLLSQCTNGKCNIAFKKKCPEQCMPDDNDFENDDSQEKFKEDCSCSRDMKVLLCEQRKMEQELRKLKCVLKHKLMNQPSHESHSVYEEDNEEDYEEYDGYTSY